MAGMAEVQLGKTLAKTLEKLLSSVSGISVKTKPDKILINPIDPSFLYGSITAITNAIIALVNGTDITPPEYVLVMVPTHYFCRLFITFIILLQLDRLGLLF